MAVRPWSPVGRTDGMVKAVRTQAEDRKAAVREEKLRGGSQVDSLGNRPHCPAIGTFFVPITAAAASEESQGYSTISGEVGSDIKNAFREVLLQELRLRIYAQVLLSVPLISAAAAVPCSNLARSIAYVRSGTIHPRHKSASSELGVRSYCVTRS